MVTESVWDTLVTHGADGVNSTDHELCRLFAELSTGNLQPLEQIYDLCATRLYGLALWLTGSGADAADVVQEVFVRLATHNSRLAAVQKPHRYLLKMIHSASIDVLRNRKRSPALNELFLHSLKSDNASQDLERLLSELLHQLPPAQREALYLRYFQGCSMREIAEITDVTLFTAASRCRLGLQKLKRKIRSR